MTELEALLALSPFVVVLILMALIFDFLNGMNDAANSIATIVSTKVLRPGQAVAMAAFFNFIAAFAVSTSVALTMGKGIISPEIATTRLVFASLLGAIVWTALATYGGLPISVSHALVGGLVGAGLVSAGPGVVQSGLWKVVAFMVLSPLIGMIFGFLFMVLALNAVRHSSLERINRWSRRLQLISASAFSFSHGLNDAQKTMGIIIFLLYGAGYFSSIGREGVGGIFVPFWVIISAHTAIALGTLVGGWRVIRTMGMRVTRLRPIHGCVAESAGAATIIGCSIAGIPVSTTHTITGAIVGVGSTKRLSAVRWGVTRNIVWAWILTIPLSALISGAAYFLTTLINPS
ncbi:MAG: inorganic phosphate transporter [Thermoplasmata archaeon]